MGLVVAPDFACLPQRGRQIVPRQALSVPQQSPPGPEVGPQSRQVVLHGGVESLQGRDGHFIHVQHFAAQGIIVFPGELRQGLPLDAVEAGGHGNLPGRVGGQLRLVGQTPDLRVWRGLQAPGFRQGQDSPPRRKLHGDGCGSVQLVSEGRPGPAAVLLHHGHHRPGLRRRLVMRQPSGFRQEKGPGRQARPPQRLLRQILLREGRQGSLQPGNHGLPQPAQPFQPNGDRSALRVRQPDGAPHGVEGLRGGELQGSPVIARQQGGQGLRLRTGVFPQLLPQRSKGGAASLQRLLKCAVGKTAVNRLRLPAWHESLHGPSPVHPRKRVDICGAISYNEYGK